LSADDLQDPFRSESAVSLVRRFKNDDNGINPSYLAQQAERESANEELAVAKAARMPSVNLEGNASRDWIRLCGK
jgi:adhesin transport system outer membrane protein